MIEFLTREITNHITGYGYGFALFVAFMILGAGVLAVRRVAREIHSRRTYGKSYAQHRAEVAAYERIQMERQIAEGLEATEAMLEHF